MAQAELRARAARDETARLQALADYRVLDTPAEGAFDSITALMAGHFRVPVAMVSLVDAHRTWFKSCHGLDLAGLPRQETFCSLAIEGDGPFVLRDATLAPVARTNPHVACTGGIRFYAGMPLVAEGGHRLGTACLVDYVPRDFAAADERMLVQFADLVMGQLELRLSAHRLVDSVARVVTGAAAGNDARELLRVCAWTKKVHVDGEWMAFDRFLESVLGVRVSHGMAPDARPD